jgi:tRNA threonylcarbamoyladenosine biosynthesis protein TsaE
MDAIQRTYILSELSQLDELASTFIARFPDGGIFTVEGEMGVGKTTFISAICKRLELDFLGSPTFSLVNEYLLEKGKALFHFDLYRLRSTEEALHIGFEEYLDRGHFVFIEWPDLVLDLLPRNTRSIKIKDLNGTREIQF